MNRQQRAAISQQTDLVQTFNVNFVGLNREMTEEELRYIKQAIKFAITNYKMDVGLLPPDSDLTCQKINISIK